MARQFAPKRMQKDWFGIAQSASGLTGSTTVLLAALISLQAQTVIRMIGEYVISPTPGGTFVAGDRVEIALGIAVVSSDAAALGSTAMPDPIGDEAYPWLFWASHKLIFAGASPGGDEITAHVRRSFDIKSMRKMKADQDLVLVAQYVDLVGAPPITVDTGTVRVLAAS